MNNMNPTQNELEITLRGIRIAIQFKHFILSLDLQSRQFILDYCNRWFKLEAKKEESVENIFISTWFENVHNIYINDCNEVLKKNQITDPIIWDTLYKHSAGSLSFQKLVAFFMNGTLPQEDIR